MDMDKEAQAWKEYSAPDEEMQNILASIPPIPSFADYGTAKELRDAITAQITRLVAAGIITPVDWTGCIKQDITIPVHDGVELRAVVYKPLPSNQDKPGALVVYFHGGGWTFGFPEAGERYFEPLVKELGVVVVSVAYRLAPERVSPGAVEDAGGAVKWCAANASTLGADLRKGFIIAGSSAGGCLATVAAHQFVDEKIDSNVTGVVLLSPNLVHSDAVPAEWEGVYGSWEEFRDGVVLDRRGMEFFYEQYKPDPASPLASPLLWHTHKGQPRTYLQVTGADPLRDEALIYEHVLRDAGVETRMDVYSGIPHGGPDMFPMHSCAGKAVEDVKEAVKWILGTDESAGRE
ncbi:Alpha/Beta hydrolase protein [Paraphoma chrysanthemicola]|uniref:Alpha/Beta hydrolase protein n=1 Tax=Paraphoma chrysanthemicola TaxID=798071 RepID=A0A8K0VSA1_9PLEO|nr:Alpha/Beta hydrolase protein [Paraphoma chrysanthemicola]